MVLRSGETRVFSSQGYPHSSVHQKCSWLITAPRDHLLEISFLDVDISVTGDRIRGFSCFHHLEVRDNVVGQRGNIYCGSSKSVGPFSTRDRDYKSNQMLLIYNTTHTSTPVGRGFKATIRGFMDGCRSSPCFHGSTCHSRGSSYKCECQAGYSGRDCDVIDEGAFYCKFEEGFCGLKNEITDEFDYHRVFYSSKYGIQENNPPITRNSGYFLVAPIEYSNPKKSYGRLVSPTFSAAQRNRCFTFYYRMGITKYQNSTLHVIKTDLTTRQTSFVFRRKGPGRVEWNFVNYDIQSSNPYTLTFEIETDVKAIYNAVVAIDDIQIRPQKCVSSVCRSTSCGSPDATCVETSRYSFKCICPTGSIGTRCQNYDTTTGFVCNFNDPKLCGWLQEGNDDFDWIRTHGASDSRRRTGPLSDVTGSGYYLVADASHSETTVNSKTHLTSPMLNFVGDVCVSFYYSMHGSELKTLSLKMKINGGLYGGHLFTQNGNLGEGWYYAEVDVRLPNLKSQLVFEAVLGRRHLSDIAIDEIKILRGLCRSQIGRSGPTPLSIVTPKLVTTTERSTTRRPTTRRPARSRRPETTRRPTITRRPTTTRRTTTKHPTTARQVVTKFNPFTQPKVLFACDFEEDMCEMAQRYPRHRWQRRNRPTTTIGTGPIRAPEGKYYLYTEGNGATRGTTYAVYTPYIKQQGDCCISTYYNMHGSGIGSLEIVLWPSSGLAKKSLWKAAGDQGSSWNYLNLDFNNVGSANILFISTRGHNDHSDIAVDSIKVTAGRCQSNTIAKGDPSKQINSKPTTQPTTRPTTRATTTTRPATRSASSAALTRKPVISHGCDFEGRHLCTLTNADQPNKWEIHSGKTASALTGPTSAYSREYYIYVESGYPAVPGDIAQLVSHSIPSNAGVVCVDFYLHMYGASIGDFNIYKRSAGGFQRRIYNKRGNQGDKWFNVHVDIPSSNFNYQIIFEYKTSVTVNAHTPWLADAAMDKLVISNNC